MGWWGKKYTVVFTDLTCVSLTICHQSEDILHLVENLAVDFERGFDSTALPLRS